LNDSCSKCSSGGKGLLVMMIFSFLGLLPVMLLTLVRITGTHLQFLEPTRKVLFFEFLLTGITTFWFFLGICIFGGTCFQALRTISGLSVSVTGTGFGYTIACFFFLIINLVLIYTIRNDSSLHLGSNAGGTDYTHDSGVGGVGGSTDYQPPASYQYNASVGQPVYGAYSGPIGSDVMPVAQQQPNIADNNL